GWGIKDYVSALCGSASANNIDLFRRSLVRQDVSIEEDGTVRPSASVVDLQFPPCLPEPKTEKDLKLAGPGATLWRYYVQGGRQAGLGWGSEPARPVSIDEWSLPRAGESDPVAGATQAGVDWSRFCPEGEPVQDCLSNRTAGAARYTEFVEEALVK